MGTYVFITCLRGRKPKSKNRHEKEKNRNVNAKADYYLIVNLRAMWLQKEDFQTSIYSAVLFIVNE